MKQYKAAFNLMFCLSIGLLAVTQIAFASDSPKRLALVFGLSEYQHIDDLKNNKDAQVMAKQLSKANFEVYPYVNSTKNEIINAIIDFKKKLNDDIVGLFYYSGHGVISSSNSNQDRFLIPSDYHPTSNKQNVPNRVIDAQCQNLTGGTGDLISIGNIINCLKSTEKGQPRLFIIDACNTPPDVVPPMGVVGSKNLRAVINLAYHDKQDQVYVVPTNLLVAYSTHINALSWANLELNPFSNEKMSWYTGYLAKFLLDRGSISMTLDKVQKAMIKDYENMIQKTMKEHPSYSENFIRARFGSKKQIPEYEDYLGINNFYFTDKIRAPKIQNF